LKYKEITKGRRPPKMAYQEDIALMAHLMRRAGFGATRDELEARVAKGYEETVEELVIVVYLGVAGCEHMVPEQRHFLFERALGVDQIVHPIEVAHWRLTARQQ